MEDRCSCRVSPPVIGFPVIGFPVIGRRGGGGRKKDKGCYKVTDGGGSYYRLADGTYYRVA